MKKKIILASIFVILIVLIYNTKGVPKKFYTIQVMASSSVENLEENIKEYALLNKKTCIFPPSVSKYYTINLGPFFDKTEAENFKEQNLYRRKHTFIRTFHISKIYLTFFPVGISKMIQSGVPQLILVGILLIFFSSKIKTYIKKRRKAWSVENTWIVWR